MGYMKAEKSIEPDEHFGGLLAHPEQRVSHYATARLIERPHDPEHSEFLRFVDHDCTAESGFPKRLFAAHIGALTDRGRSTVTRERLPRLAVQTYEGTPEQWQSESEVDSNPGNWLAWEVLGHALYDQNNQKEGEECFKQLIERCPATAVRLCEIYREAIASGELPPSEHDPRSRFWLSVDTATLEGQVAARRGAS